MNNFNNKEFISTCIKSHRKKMNLTQAELAEKIDISDQHMSRIESGHYIPSLKTFFMLVDILKIDLREFGFLPENTQNPKVNRIINKIINSSDAELILFENLIESVSKSISQIKNNIL